MNYCWHRRNYGFCNGCHECDKQEETWTVEGYFGPDGHADSRTVYSEKRAIELANKHGGIYYKD